MKIRTEYRTQFGYIGGRVGEPVKVWQDSQNVYQDPARAKAALAALAHDYRPGRFNTGRVRAIERVITTEETVLAEAGETVGG